MKKYMLVSLLVACGGPGTTTSSEPAPKPPEDTSDDPTFVVLGYEPVETTVNDTPDSAAPSSSDTDGGSPAPSPRCVEIRVGRAWHTMAEPVTRLPSEQARFRTLEQCENYVKQEGHNE